jgi:hypothetical protein
MTERLFGNRNFGLSLIFLGSCSDRLIYANAYKQRTYRVLQAKKLTMKCRAGDGFASNMGCVGARNAHAGEKE